MLSVSELKRLAGLCALPVSHEEHVSTESLRQQLNAIPSNAPIPFLMLKDNARHNVVDKHLQAWFSRQVAIISKSEASTTSSSRVVASDEHRLQAELEWYIAHWREVSYDDEDAAHQAKVGRMNAIRQLGKYCHSHYGKLLGLVQKQQCHLLLQDVLDIGVNVVWAEYKKWIKGLSVIFAKFLSQYPTIMNAGTPPNNEMQETSCIWRQDPRVQSVLNRWACKGYTCTFENEPECPKWILERSLLPNFQFAPMASYQQSLHHARSPKVEPQLRALATIIIDAQCPKTRLEHVKRILSREPRMLSDYSSFVFGLLLAFCTGALDVAELFLSGAETNEASVICWDQMAACSAYCRQEASVQILARMDVDPFFILGGAIEHGVQYDNNSFFRLCPSPKFQLGQEFYQRVLSATLKSVGQRKNVFDVVLFVVKRGDIDTLKSIHCVLVDIFVNRNVIPPNQHDFRVAAANSGRVDILRWICDWLMQKCMTFTEYSATPGEFLNTGIDTLLQYWSGAVKVEEMIHLSIRLFVSWRGTKDHALGWLYQRVSHMVRLRKRRATESGELEYRQTIWNTWMDAVKSRTPSYDFSGRPSHAPLTLCSCNTMYGEVCHASEMVILLMRECAITWEDNVNLLVSPGVTLQPLPSLVLSGTSCDHSNLLDQQQLLIQTLKGRLCPNLLHSIFPARVPASVLNPLFVHVPKLYHACYAKQGISTTLYLYARGCSLASKNVPLLHNQSMADAQLMTLYGLGFDRTPECWDAKRLVFLDDIRRTIEDAVGGVDAANIVLSFC